MDYEIDKNPINGDLREFNEVTFQKVDETKWEKFWDELVAEYHYLGYKGQMGTRIKYLILVDARLIGAISFCAGAYKLGPRDKYIGWDETMRQNMLQHVISNNRFLILPWVRIRNLASHVLSKVLVQLRADWEKQYETIPFIIETFVDRERFVGTCYIAANWTYLGTTKGYSRHRNNFVYHGRIKDIYVYIVDKSFAQKFKPDLRRLRNIRGELEAMINGIPAWTPTILNEIGIEGDFTEQIRHQFIAHSDRYMGYLGNKNNRYHFTVMQKGLLSNIKRKSIEPIALAFMGTSNPRNLMNFMTSSKWDEEGMHEEYRNDVSEMLSHEGSMITIDGTDFPKKGDESVGVARQRCGQLGKVDNCQASVMVGYVSRKGYALIDYELYIPKKWFGDNFSEKREKCGIPKKINFRTKNQIASEMISAVVASGLFPAKYVGADSAFGCDYEFLDSLPEGIIYFVDVKHNCRVFDKRPSVSVPTYKGKGKKPTKEVTEFAPRTVKEIAEDENIPWNNVVLGIGAKGPIITVDKFIQVIEVRDGLPGKDVWLYMRKLTDGKIKYALCNESSDATAIDLRRPALMRWSIEQCFKECKDYLGMDHYELRSWDGWHRHILLCHISHLFVIKLRMEYAYRPQPTTVAPYINEAVNLADYINAVANLQDNTAITNPNISEIPGEPQQILTIGLVQQLIDATFPKPGHVLKKIDYHLRANAKSFESHSKNGLEKARIKHIDEIQSNE